MLARIGNQVRRPVTSWVDAVGGRSGAVLAASATGKGPTFWRDFVTTINVYGPQLSEEVLESRKTARDLQEKMEKLSPQLDNPDTRSHVVEQLKEWSADFAYLDSCKKYNGVSDGYFKATETESLNASLANLDSTDDVLTSTFIKLMGYIEGYNHGLKNTELMEKYGPPPMEGHYGGRG